ncbi:hypothetical protein SAMN04487891_10970 [Flagellimonas taeanensis]|uniref:Uncharacterized protein n=1 Tax=Flagellimonas taeanensis TaxID=1005926 RepID=A0A1M7AJ70_9FLAO|nr:hypothetical protein SAMN04487891_10970 [Allomuricauda taeanensis]SHL42804.1 hypothetical protein SAMN05216293_3439 [Allomuricauda taeanensis]
MTITYKKNNTINQRIGVHSSIKKRKKFINHQSINHQSKKVSTPLLITGEGVGTRPDPIWSIKNEQLI